jgi:hypothetical protein
MIDLSFRAPLRALSAVLVLALSSGCSDLRNCPNDNPDPITIDTGVSDATTIAYQSAPDCGPLDKFPAKTKLRFTHDLGVTPLVVKVYLAFDATGTNCNGPGSIAESAGNQALINCKDAHVIEIHNDTCEDFFIQVVATDAVPTKDGESPDASKRCGE